MILRPSGTSTCLALPCLIDLKLALSLSVKTSAMATSLVGAPLTDKALPAAPVPRPPQPTRATRMVESSPAWTCGTATPVRAVAAAAAPVVWMRARRDRPPSVGLLTIALPWVQPRRRAAGGIWDTVVRSGTTPGDFGAGVKTRRRKLGGWPTGSV